MTVPEWPTEKRVIRTFTSAQWDGKRGFKARSLLAKFTAKRFLVGLAVLAILTRLGAFGAVAITLGVVALLLWILSEDKIRQKFADELIADANETIVGLTGDATAGLSRKTFESLCSAGGRIPLPVNGVPGLELSVVSDRPAVERIAAIARVDETVRTSCVTVFATPPDYGTASFDRLLQATLDAD
ncbi:hypothetical protein [Arthrobacter sp. ES3-54]|uniref:hypothetical protein n=1 Tax=Arthrobacter sp. ES3-54 TaxID=1502991 RepID=UPI0024051AC8|nr:hypothetical protein [Arthrobacter sp. ES3-54]MDF9751569.1 hypothetical protein [Arthrobacter sp. ES3-54]